MKRFVMAALAIAALEGLGGCAHTQQEPEIQIREVKIPVPVACKATVDTNDSYADAAAATVADIFEQVRLLLVGREQRNADIARLRGAVTGCGGTVQ